MEPILLSFDKIRYDSDITQLHTAAKYLTPKFQQIVELSGIELTDKLVKELLQANDPVFTLQAVKAKIISSLESAGVRIRAIREASTNQAVEDFYSIFNEVSNIRRNYLALGFPYSLCWNGEGLQINEQWAEDYKEHFSSYVKTEEGEALRQAHIKYFAAAQEFYAALPERSRELIFRAIVRAANPDNSLKGIHLPEWDYDFAAAIVNPWDPRNKPQ